MSWFQDLVDQNPIGQALFDSFSDSPDYQDLSSDDNPHGLSPSSAGQIDGTKVYVPGTFSASEFASRDDHAQFAMHLLDQATWNISVSFASTVANTLSQELDIPYDPTSPGLTTQVAPGVFSRNLYLLRKYQTSATAYAEGPSKSDKTSSNPVFGHSKKNFSGKTGT